MKTKSAKVKIFAVCILLLAAVVCIHPISAESTDKVNVPIFTIPEKTIVYDGKAGPEGSALSTYTQSSLNIPEFITESSNAKKASKEIGYDEEIYSVLTFDNPIPVRSETLEFDISLYGEEYTVNLERMPDNLDDGIDSYLGVIEGVTDSQVVFTVNDKNLLIGSISYPGEYLTITVIDSNIETKNGKSPMHIVYSEYDILQPSEPIDFCGMPEPTVSEMLERESFLNKNDDSRATNSLVTVDVLVVTDNYFSENPLGIYGGDWVSISESYIADANSVTSFGREDVGVFLNVIAYDSSRKNQLSSHPDILTDPIVALEAVYPKSYLDSIGADICLYLGGYDRIGPKGHVQGRTDDYKGRYAWCQMVADGISSYNGNDYSRKYCIIHEIGHCFDGRHEQSYPKWFDGAIFHDTVMIDRYLGSGCNLLEFSSTASPSYLGDATHDNARIIRNCKVEISLHA